MKRKLNRTPNLRIIKDAAKGQPPDDENDPGPLFAALMDHRETVKAFLLEEDARRKRPAHLVSADGVNPDEVARVAGMKRVDESNKRLTEEIVRSLRAELPS